MIWAELMVNRQKKRVLLNEETEYIILNSDSDMEESSPPSISSEPAACTMDATVASPEPLQLIEETIDYYHTLSSAPVITASSENSPLLLHKPLMSGLAMARLDDEDMESSWDFKKDCSWAAEVATALNEIMKAWHRVKDESDPRLEELIGIIRLWDLAYFLSTISKTMAEELIRVRR